jgi:arsenate reductase-like glutaredoxin family protein
VSAGKKLQRTDARRIAVESSKVIVMKGKNVDEFAGGPASTDALLDAMLGSTGNLRAPLLRVGKITLVGFNEEVYRRVL